MEVAERTALILHGWNDDPNAGWLGWLQAELGRRGFHLFVPVFSTEARPLLPQWQAQLDKYAPELNEGSLIVAHSLGAFLALRLLEALPTYCAVGAVVLVSGFYDAPNPSARRWFEPEPDWQKLQAKAARYICVYSDDDTIVTPDRTRRLAHKLSAELVCLPGHGHFLGSRGLNQLPELIELLEDSGALAS